LFSFSGALLTCIIIAVGNNIYAVNFGLYKTCDSCLFEYAITNTTSFQLNTMAQSGTMIYGFGNIILALTLTAYIVVAFYSVVYAYARLNRPGVSKEVRAMCFKKHLYYVIMFVVIWTI